MRKHILRTITVLAALSVSTLAVALAWASAQQRATTDEGRFLQACVAVIFVVLIHILPTLLRRRHPLVLWPVWLICLSLAGFWHASWFYLSGQLAAEARHAGSAAVAAAAQERHSIEQVLKTIRARPVSTVAAQLARTADPEMREALAAELAEARRAAGLHDRQIVLSRNASGTDQVHPGTPEERSGTMPERDVTLALSVVAALLLGVLGALLWSAALAGDDDAAAHPPAQHAPVQTVVQQVVNVLAPVLSRPVHAGVVEVVDELADLQATIARGECRPSARGIKEYMGCGSDTAARLRRQLIDR